jgi:hypothetical protein
MIYEIRHKESYRQRYIQEHYNMQITNNKQVLISLGNNA